jgi:hypothetical protein
VIPEIRLVVCANAADNADNGWLGITDVWLVTTDRFECDAIISCARAGRAGGVLSISIMDTSMPYLEYFHTSSIRRTL